MDGMWAIHDLITGENLGHVATRAEAERAGHGEQHLLLQDRGARCAVSASAPLPGMHGHIRARREWCRLEAQAHADRYVFEVVRECRWLREHGRT
jgi:hypothetical protein